MTKKTDLARTQNPTDPVDFVAALAAAMGPRPRSGLDMLQQAALLLRTLAETAERAHAVGWTEIEVYCRKQALDLVKSPSVETPP